MKIQEYQAKQILTEYGIQIPKGFTAETPAGAKSAAEKLKMPLMVKAQIIAGGRGKAGGIRTADSPAEAEEIASRILETPLATAQTFNEKIIVRKILIEEKIDLAKEFYLGIAIDAQKECPVIIISNAGGTEIEEIAEKQPKKILKLYINPLKKLGNLQIIKLIFGLRIFNPPLILEIAGVISNLYRLFKTKECLLAEINPLGLTHGNKFIALDAKMNFDDDTLFRHQKIAALNDLSDCSPAEKEAKQHGINYIRLNGNIGCLVNGAGLAMATMDEILLAGGYPANFLDIGGGASPQKIETAFRILTSDPQIKVIFINIFGGISRCDFVAKGILLAMINKKIYLPLVVRLEGTNAAEGIEMLKKNLSITAVSTIKEGVRKAVELAVKGANL